MSTHSTDRLDELRLCHRACEPWFDPAIWVRYFAAAQEILGANVTHLDANDPVRRRVNPGELAITSEYLTSLGPKESHRMVFGRMQAIKVTFSIDLDKNLTEWHNVINWYFPRTVWESESRLQMVQSLFQCGNSLLSPFYADSDVTRVFAALKKELNRAVNVQRELSGVYWLTYFNSRYVEFIGKEKFDALRDVDVTIDNGATLCLGKSPWAVTDDIRRRCEATLGANLFVDRTGLITKRPGQYVLTFDQLRERKTSH